MNDRLITVFETKHFLRLKKKLISDKEFSELLGQLKKSPKDGDVIRGTGGIRKIRWARPGSGKRSGIRVIYYFYDKNGILFMLTAYAKNDKVDLTKKEKEKYSDLVKVLTETFQKR
jgi:hypothetical protein